MNYSFAWVFGIMGLQRVFELVLSRRNRRALEALGGREFHPETFPTVVVLHVLFFASLAVESYPWRFPLDARTVVCLIALALLTGARYWCIASLGRYWNVRIVVVPGGAAKRSGPYRYLRHPNYLVLVLEFLFIPLLLRAPVTLVVFSLANLAFLRQRIRLEEKALRELTDYGKVYPAR
jgi:methyltransferase